MLLDQRLAAGLLAGDTRAAPESNGTSLMSSASMICSEIVELLTGGGRAVVRPAIHWRLSSDEQVAALREPVVIEHRVHPLLPLRALVREQMAGSGPGRGDRGCARAGSTTPAAARSTKAPADAARRPSRSWHASSGPCSAAASAGSARVHLGADPARAPRPRTASPSSPQAPPRGPHPRKRTRNFRTAARSAGTILARETSGGDRVFPIGVSAAARNAGRRCCRQTR